MIALLIAMAMFEPDESLRFFTELYMKHRTLMYGTALKYLKNPFDAEDVVHDAVLKLMDKADVISELESCTLTAYVVYTIRNLSINQLRRQERGRRHLADAEDNLAELPIADSSPQPEDVVLIHERRDKFVAIWRTLPEDTQALLAGKYLLQQSDRELAEAFGCSPDSIRMKLTRARRQVVARIKEGEFDFEPA